MTLKQMRDMLRANIFEDGQNVLTDTMANAYLNAAMRHIGNWADAQDQALFIVAVSHSTKTAGFYGIRFNTGGNPNDPVPNWGIPLYAPVRRVRKLSALAGNSTRQVQLKKVEFEDFDAYTDVEDSDTNEPAWCVRGQQTLLSNVKETLKIVMNYSAALPDMAGNDDTPGEISGQGTPNALPIEYHPLIPTYAAVLALTAENIDPAGWRACYTEMLGELQATLQGRRGTRPVTK